MNSTKSTSIVRFSLFFFVRARVGIKAMLGFWLGIGLVLALEGLFLHTFLKRRFHYCFYFFYTLINN